MTTITKQLADALRAIKEQRDHHAEHGSYRPGTMGEDQCFDDWAADIAETVLAAYDAQQAATKMRGAWRVDTGGDGEIELWAEGAASPSNPIEPIATVYNMEDAARIVACVNACRGMTLDEIESFGSPGELGRCAQLWASDDGEEVTP